MACLCALPSRVVLRTRCASQLRPATAVLFRRGPVIVCAVPGHAGGGPDAPATEASLRNSLAALQLENDALRARVAALSAGGAHPGPGDGGATPVRRTGIMERNTKETQCKVVIDLDGTGKCTADTGVGFLDHMLHQLASHGLFDLTVTCKGDLWIDDHHSVEDVAITLGQAIALAVGDKRGLRRFGHMAAPLDEALIHVTLDLSGRPHTSLHGWYLSTEKVGGFSTQMAEHFFTSLANEARMTLHIQQLAGTNSHHIIEATFKALAKSLRQAVEMDPRNAGAVPSSKGYLSI